MKDKSVEANIENNSITKNNFFESKLFQNNSNITGITIENNYIKKKKEFNKIKNLKSSNNKINNIKKSISPNKNFKKTELSYYQSLTNKDKVKFIQNLINNSNTKEPFDFLAVKRKRYSLSYLIHQFDVSEKSKSFEENNICKRPYPLLYCISNRKIGNDSSNLMTKILSSENKTLSKKQENFIKNSIYSKIFSMDISDLIQNNIRSKNTLKFFSRIMKNRKSKISNKNLPFLNKYIKSKVINYKYKILNRNNSNNGLNSSSGFFSEENQIKLTKNLKRWNSTFYMNINGKANLIDKDKKNDIFKNNVESFKNRTVCLNSHKNNKINSMIINERNNKIIDETFFRKRKKKHDPRFNGIIKDISHLRFNSQIMPFKSRLKEI